MTFEFKAKDGTVVTVAEGDISGMGYAQLGICRACGAEHDPVEPDARKYPCEECEEKEVYGAQELMIMGEIA